MNWREQFAKRTRQMRRTAVRELLKVTARPDIISFAGGLPAAELFPVAEVKAAAGAVLDRLGGPCLQYSETEGLPALRDWVAGKFSHDHFQVRRENVLITAGAQQALDLVGRVLLNEGDRVVVENPTYLAALSAWRPLGVEFVPAPTDAGGLRMDSLGDCLARPPKMIYSMPNFQNPQGTTLAPERRTELARLLRAREVALVEDGAYTELRYDGQPSPHLLELDAEGGPPAGVGNHVILLGTFSKVLAPGLRVGWVIAAPEVIEKLVQAKQAADLHTGTLSQHIALELAGRGFLDQFLPLLRRNYRERRDAMLAALEEYFPPDTTWTRPDGGLFLLVTLPAGTDASALLPLALAEKVAFVPGEEFHLKGAGRNTMRLNFSNAHPAQIATGIERLGRIVARAGKAPADAMKSADQLL
jgi:2-aminoadipate transaminase